MATLAVAMHQVLLQDVDAKACAGKFDSEQFAFEECVSTPHAKHAKPTHGCDMTPSTSCGSFTPRGRCYSEFSAEEECELRPFELPESDDETEEPPSLSYEGTEPETDAESSVPAHRPSSDASFGSERRLGSGATPVPPAPCSSASGRLAAAAFQERRPGCLSGCLPWLFSPLGGSSWQQSLPRPPLWARQRPDGLVEYELERLQHIGLLGCGSFGSVTLVRCGITGKSFALKAVSKGLIVERRLEHTLAVEKQAMRRCRSPFVIQLAATFNRAQHVYFLLEAVMGGDLYTVYSRRFLFGSEKHARFYTACVVRALEHLHSRWIMYRDLKLENVVLDANGYGKLCDFGLSALLSPEQGGRAFTVCGTPEYMAPEVMCGVAGYTVAADWWSLGVLLYEMMVAETPFAAEDPSLVLLNIERGIEETGLPKQASWANVVRGLCELEPQHRVPMLEDGVAQLEQQAWFTMGGFDWARHARRCLEAPFVPAVAGPKDLSNFSAGGQCPPPEVSYEDPGNGWDADFEDRLGVWFEG